jgi:hypothetical protein
VLEAAAQHTLWLSLLTWLLTAACALGTAICIAVSLLPPAFRPCIDGVPLRRAAWDPVLGASTQPSSARRDAATAYGQQRVTASSVGCQNKL